MRDAVVVITGAARGIGREIALAFARNGARLALVDILADELGETAAMVAEIGSRALIAPADITDPVAVARFAERVRGNLGTPDVLINNAGTFSVIAPVWEAGPSAWLGDVQVNLGGAFLLCHAFVGGMVESGRGYVVNVVSSGGVGDPHPHCTSYASSKAGLMRLTEGLAAETREHGVKVFAVAPPAVLTHMTRFIMHDPGGRKWRPGFGRLFDAGRSRVHRCDCIFLPAFGDHSEHATCDMPCRPRTTLESMNSSRAASRGRDARDRSAGRPCSLSGCDGPRCQRELLSGHGLRDHRSDTGEGDAFPAAYRRKPVCLPHLAAPG